MANLYVILGVSHTASSSEIKSAYRRLARLYHPDVNTDPAAAEMFARVTDAYRTLIDASRREEYDRAETSRKTTQLHAEANRIARRIQYQERADRIVNDWIIREKEETRARGKAIFTTTTLFLSTFLVAMTRPMLIESIAPLWQIGLMVLFVGGVLHLFGSLRQYFEIFTYKTGQSGRRMKQSRNNSMKPFRRSVAWTFVVGGYLLSFLAGLLIGTLTADYASTHTIEESVFNALWKVLFYPPMAVLIVDTIYKINLRFEG
jgi:curved DNA-binding protein CbpA